MGAKNQKIAYVRVRVKAIVRLANTYNVVHG